MFNYSKIIRQKLLSLTDSLSIDELNVVPKGLNNNIIWQLGHISVSTPILCYVRTGIEIEKAIPHSELFKNGTKPTQFIGNDILLEIKSYLLKSIDDIEQDYANGTFKQTTPFATHTFGKPLNTIEEVFECCNFHDSVHYGNVGIIKKLIH